jgi:hypothetical protein
MKKLVVQQRMSGPITSATALEDRGMVDQLVGPGEQQMRLVPQVALDRRARGRFVGLEPGAVSASLGRAQDP